MASRTMKIAARVIMETMALSGNQKRVNLINTGVLKYPLNIMIPVAERNFAKDLDKSLATLKSIPEK